MRLSRTSIAMMRDRAAPAIVVRIEAATAEVAAEDRAAVAAEVAVDADVEVRDAVGIAVAVDAAVRDTNSMRKKFGRPRICSGPFCLIRAFLFWHCGHELRISVFCSQPIACYADWDSWVLRSQIATSSLNMKNTSIVLVKKVDSKILILRGQKVILDADLAELYGVPVKRLNQQVKRNASRFPFDFVFRLSRVESENLRSQIATSSGGHAGHGGRRYLPQAFTEHGAIMAATVLNSKRAVGMSIFVVRAFVRMRGALAMNQQIMGKLADLERRVEDHDVGMQELVNTIQELLLPPPANSRRIGFEIPQRAGKKQSGRLKVHTMAPPAERGVRGTRGSLRH